MVGHPDRHGPATRGPGHRAGHDGGRGRPQRPAHRPGVARPRDRRITPAPACSGTKITTRVGPAGASLVFATVFLTSPCTTPGYGRMTPVFRRRLAKLA